MDPVEQTHVDFGRMSKFNVHLFKDITSCFMHKITGVSEVVFDVDAWPSAVVGLSFLRIIFGFLATTGSLPPINAS